ncbi:MAG: threonylcarbamoyl-AMP synthase [Lachnospiraceae bacterium]|nr:threonylcarbamoyl-AMP synthase [Lachnospiraceae bacterium]
MNTKVVKINRIQPNPGAIYEAGLIIKNGGLVAFPTETVYGLGGDAFNSSSSKKIYEAKGRPSDNPLIVHIANITDIDAVATDIPSIAYELAAKYWPGPLTMILKKRPELPKETTGGLDTVAVRMPVNEVALDLITAAGGFVAAPSANRSGKPSPTLAQYVIEDMYGFVDMIIDGGDCEIGLESTIIDLTSSPAMILRPGYITFEELKEMIPDIVFDGTILDASSEEAPKAPGMKYRHYAPKAEMILVTGPTENVIAYINEKATRGRENGQNIGVIATDETQYLYVAPSIKTLGSRNNEKQIAKNLFRILREFDDEDTDIIYAESFEEKGVFRATMNRMIKASGNKEVRV